MNRLWFVLPAKAGTQGRHRGLWVLLLDTRFRGCDDKVGRGMTHLFFNEP
jgi:hypothetical protein